jgi:hypothetical protein
VTTINGEFLVHLPQTATLVEDFLPKSQSVFIAINFFAISGAPTTAPGNDPPVNQATR